MDKVPEVKCQQRTADADVMLHTKAIRGSLLGGRSGTRLGLLLAILFGLSSCAEDQAPLSNVAPYSEQLYRADRPDCVEGLVELDSAVVSRQHCSADTDCAVIYSGGCPLDCFVAVNPSSVTEVQTAFKVFASHCPANYCECSAKGPLEGVCASNNRCVVQLAQ